MASEDSPGLPKSSNRLTDSTPVDILNSEQRDTLISACFDAPCAALGLKKRERRSWIDGSKPPVRRLFELHLLKGAGIKACWGFSLDFVPHISAGRVRLHRTDKSAMLEFVIDPRVMPRVTFLRGEQRLLSDLQQLLPVALQRAQETWARGSTFEGLLTTVSDLQKDNTNCFGFQNYTQLPMTFAFLLAKLQDMTAAKKEIEPIVKSRDLDEEETEKLMQLLHDAALPRPVLNLSHISIYCWRCQISAIRVPSNHGAGGQQPPVLCVSQLVRSVMRISRREFMQLSAASAIAAGCAARAQTAPTTAPAKPFEVAASLYPWDLHDEGVEKVLDNVQQMAAVNSVYLIGLMHPERRPLTSGTFPHNPARQFWMAEDARAYWKPDPKKYGRIKPRLSDNDWLNQTDWMRTLADAARKRGLRLGMEFSHALCDKVRVEGEFADVAQRDIRGAITHVRDWLRPLCPNHPDTREFAVSAASEVAATYSLDYVESCIVSMDEAVGGSPARGGGCFCDACQKAAAAMNVDLPAIQKALLANPAAQPELGQWQKFRFDSVAAFYEMIHRALAKVKPGIDLRYNIHAKNPRDWGVDIIALKPHIDSLRIMDYSEQQGQAAALNDKRIWLTQIRKDMGPDFPLISAVAVRPRATPEVIRAGTAITLETKMNGISLGHYDGAEFPMLRAIRDALTTAKIIPQATAPAAAP